jgi:hypothetical protein
MRTATMNLLEENIRERLQDTGTGKKFLGEDPKIIGNKSKTRQMKLQQTKNLLHSKVNNCKSEKTTYQIGENSSKLHI